MSNFIFVVALLAAKQCLAVDSTFYGIAGRERIIEFIRQNPEVLDQADKIKAAILPLVSTLPSDIAQLPPGPLPEIKGTKGKGRNPTYLQTKSSLTSGRKFVPDATWSFWMNVNYYNMRDQRYGLDLDGNSVVFILGADKKLTKNLVGGVMLYSQNFRTTNLGGNWNSNTDGLAVGPYIGYRLSHNWAITANLVYGQARNNNSIDAIIGNFRSSSYSGQVKVVGQYSFGEINILPKPSVFYSYIHNQSYRTSGIFAGTNINLAVPSANFAVGIADFTLEINRNFELASLRILEPYIEAGVQYEFERPNNGQILTGNLFLVSTAPWNGTLRLGTRLLITDALFIEGSAGYLSIGHPDLNIWEAKLYLAYSFG